MTTDISDLMRVIATVCGCDVRLEYLKGIELWSAGLSFGNLCIGESAHEALCKLYDAVVAEKAKATGQASRMH